MSIGISEHPNVQEAYAAFMAAVRKLGGALGEKDVLRIGQRVNWLRGARCVEGKISHFTVLTPWQVYVVPDDNNAGEGEWRMLHEVSLVVA